MKLHLVSGSPLKIADRTFSSHLFTGTGKFASNSLMRESVKNACQPQGGIGVLPGMVATMQGAEAIKIITGGHASIRRVDAY